MLIDIQGKEINEDFHVIPLNSYDLVLGAKWLKRGGPVWWDFTNMILSYKEGSEEVRISGITTSHSSLISGKRLKEACREKCPMALLQLTSTMISAHEQTHLTDCQQHELDRMLINFSELFEEPCGLPPTREYDHAIVLKEGTKPIHVKP